MRIRHVLALMAALVLAAPVISPAQSLGEIAEKEKEKKKKPTHIFTEDDLHKGSALTPAPTASPAAPGATATADAKDAKAKQPAAKTDDEVRAEQQKAWQTKLDAARKDVETLTKAVGEMEAVAADVRGSLYGAGRTKQLNELADAKKQLATSQQSVADLEEEGRRSRFQ